MQVSQYFSNTSFIYNLLFEPIIKFNHNKSIKVKYHNTSYNPSHDFSNYNKKLKYKLHTNYTTNNCN